MLAMRDYMDTNTAMNGAFFNVIFKNEWCIEEKTNIQDLSPSGKLTWQWECIFTRDIFHCHVSLPEGTRHGEKITTMIIECWVGNPCKPLFTTYYCSSVDAISNKHIDVAPNNMILTTRILNAKFSPNFPEHLVKTLGKPLKINKRT